MQRVKETWDEAVVRLAATARERGIAIYCHDLGESPEFFATSASRPGTLHRVTLVSCDCQGFIAHQRCTHHARLLDEVGELPVPPAPVAPAEAGMLTIEIVCACCGGDATVTRKDRNGDPWAVTCTACGGRGRHTIAVAVADLAHLDHWDTGQLRGVQCGTCRGRGYRAMKTGGHLSDWEPVACRSCQGAGMVPVPLRECDRIAA